MPLTTVTLHAEKNAVAQSVPFLFLITITIPGEPAPLRIVANTEDVVWDGDTYTGYPCELDPPPHTTGEVPAATLRVSTANDLLTTLVMTTRGLPGTTVAVVLVHASHLSDAAPQMSMDFDVVGEPGIDAAWVEIPLGVRSPMRAIFPGHRYNTRFCRFRFRSPACGYTGGTATGSGISFTAPSTITTTGTSWVTLGFRADQTIRVAGSAANDRDYTLTAVTATTLTVTETTITSAAAGPAVTVAAICPKSLAACVANRRADSFGGSPGAEAGVYAD